METSYVDLPVLFSCNNSCCVPQLGAVRSFFSDNCWVTLLPDKGSSRTDFFQEYRLIINFKYLFFLEKKVACTWESRVCQLLEICWLHSKLQGSCKGFFFGESKSLLWTVFGKITLYLSCTVCLWCILWKHGCEPTWETNHTCQATKWVTDERWNKSLSNTTRCLRDRAEAIRWAHTGKLCYPGLLCQGNIWWGRTCFIYMWGKEHYISVSCAVQACHQLPSFNIIARHCMW